MTTKIKLPLWGNRLGMCLRKRKEVLTSEEAASYLDVSMPQLYRLTSKKLIPFYSPTGGKLYFKRSELDNWMLSNRSATTQEIEVNSINYLINKKIA